MRFQTSPMILAYMVTHCSARGELYTLGKCSWKQCHQHFYNKVTRVRMAIKESLYRRISLPTAVITSTSCLLQMFDASCCSGKGICKSSAISLMEQAHRPLKEVRKPVARLRSPNTVCEKPSSKVPKKNLFSIIEGGQSEIWSSVVFKRWDFLGCVHYRAHELTRYTRLTCRKHSVYKQLHVYTQICIQIYQYIHMY